MSLATLFASLALAIPFGPVIHDAQSSGQMLQISTPTYFSDGTVMGASAGAPVQLNLPLVLYPYSGRTLCESSSATATVPTDAGYGWRVQIVPLRNTDGLVLQVDWQRLWDRGEKLTNGQRGKAQVTLHPGDRILFDYLSVGERAISANMAAEVAQVTGRRGCDAIGMGLEIGLPPVESTALIEANLWLVRTLANGTEQSQHQTIRVKPGAAVDFYFDDVKVPVTDANGKPFFFVNRDVLGVRTFGRMSKIDVANGKVQLELKIEQYISDGPGRDGGSTTFPMTAGPEEVLSFQVPRVTVMNGGKGERLALRVQVKQIR